MTNVSSATRAVRRSIGPVLLVAFCIASGCGRPVNRAAERRIRDMLPSLVGNAREYRVHVDGSGTVEGKLSSVTVDGDDITLSDGLLIDRLHLDMHNVQVDVAHGKLKSVESARFTATIGQAALEEYLAGESPQGESLRNIHISIRPNQVTLSAERVLLGVGIPFRAYGPLRLTGPHTIELDSSRLVVVGIPIMGLPLTFLKGRFESAVDLSTLPVPILLDQVHTVDRAIVVSGSPDIATMLRMQAQEGER